MRQIKSMVFLGNQNSSEEVAYLHLLLDKAVMMLGALQQPNRAEDENHFKQLVEARIKDELELQDLISDLVTAFGFDPSDMTFKKLPYRP
jgi:hypothetical protein